MYEKLEEIEKRYDELQRKIAQPEVATDVAVFRDAMKAIAEIQDVVAKFRELKSVDRKSTRLNSSHTVISYAVFCLKKKKKKKQNSAFKRINRKRTRLNST